MSEQRLMFQDKSITSLSGASQQVEGLNGQRQLVFIENTGNANLAVNFSGPSTGGTQTTTGIGNIAALGATGCITIVPNGSLLLDHVVPQNPINIIGTAGQPVTVILA